MISETHIVSPSLINEFRFGYNWGVFSVTQSDANIPAEQLIPGMGGVPFTGYAGPNGGIPYINWEGQIGLQGAANMTSIRRAPKHLPDSR